MPGYWREMGTSNMVALVSIDIAAVAVVAKAIVVIVMGEFGEGFLFSQNLFWA